MIDLSDKTMSNLLASMLLQVTEQVNKREGSLIRTALSAAAWVAEGLYIELMNVQNQAYGTSATGEYLDLKVAERGIARHSATNEVCILKCNLSTVEQGFQFGDSSGYTWNVTSDVISSDNDGLYNYQITCQTEGEIAEPTGDLRSLSFLAGLTIAKFGKVISVGRNKESDANLRKRYEESLVEIAFAGNVDAYREKLLELEYTLGETKATIGALQVFAVTDAEGNRRGGNVKIWIVDSDMQAASSELVESVQEAICPMYNGVAVGLGNGFAPIGSAVHIASATAMPKLSIEIKVTLEGTTVEAVRPKITENIISYVRGCLNSWSTQVKTPYDSALITIKEAFIYSAALVKNVTDVVYVKLKKDNIEHEGSVSWETTGAKMEWLDINDVEVNIVT